MRYKFLFFAAGMAMVSFSAFSAIIVKLPEQSGISEIEYMYAPVQKLANAATRAEAGIETGKTSVDLNSFTINIPENEGGLYYYLNITDNDNLSLYVEPGDEIITQISSLEPFTYTISGNVFAEGMSEIYNISLPLEIKQKELLSVENPDVEALEKLEEEYASIMKDYIQNNNSSPKALIALLELNGEDYLEFYQQMPTEAISSFVFPIAEQKYRNESAQVEKQRKQKAMMSGEVVAPSFTLKDLEGKDVSLSEFRGKWVILDFWGSWCIWCIKGFPELKEAYEKYAGRLEIIGIDCNETEQAWRDGVKKYELPWVNVYCPKGNDLTVEYGVQGFPTKAIIDPEGKIRNITTGHDPNFFHILDELMK